MGVVSRLVRVASVGEIPVGRGKPVDLDGLPLAVFNAGSGRYRALWGACPHEGGPAAMGYGGEVEDFGGLRIDFKINGQTAF